MVYECIVVGGGLAGLQAAIQLGRYGHQALVIDAGYGRSTLCRSYHNMLGWPDGISGNELRRLGRMQAGRYGIEFAQDRIVEAVKTEDGFTLTGQEGNTYRCRTLLLATGLLDRFPEIPGLKPCLGKTIYVCPDCDGYEIKDKQTVVLGSGDPGANMALMLAGWTDRMTYINHEKKPVKPELLEKLKQKGIRYEEKAIGGVLAAEDAEDGGLEGFRLESGETVRGERGFIAFGGNQVNTELAKQLGVERLENKHVVTDPRTKMTNVPNVWCAGDINVHSEQATIAMGEGSLAAIWIHKTLMKSAE